MSGVPEGYFTQVVFSLALKHDTRLERPHGNKHSSLLGQLIRYKINKVLRIKPWGCVNIDVIYEWTQLAIVT